MKKSGIHVRSGKDHKLTRKQIYAVKKMIEECGFEELFNKALSDLTVKGYAEIDINKFRSGKK